MIRVCPERDTECPHGMDCSYAVDRYTCNEDKAGTASPDHAELRRLAEAATPGGWGAESPHGDDLLSIVANPEAEVYDWLTVALLPLDDPKDGPAVSKIQLLRNATFIAAANPAAILALLDELKQLRCNQSHLEELETALRSRVSELEGALAPFIDKPFVKYMSPELPDSHSVSIDVKLGWLRTARAALSRAGEAADRGGEDA